jgi:heat shock protein HslJ
MLALHLIEEVTTGESTMKTTTTRGPLFVLMTIGLAGLACTLSRQVPVGEPTPRTVVTRMTDALIGPLRIVDGCLVIGEGEARHVVVWPPDFEVSREGDVMWVFRDNYESEFRLGETVSLLGGEVESIEAFDERTRQQVSTGCEGPYWLVANVSPAGAESAVSGSEALAATEWQLLSIDGTRLIEGTEITLSFGEAYLGGTMTCNDYGSGPLSCRYEATKDGRLEIYEPFAVGTQLCSEPAGIMEQEAAYIEALRTATAYRMALDTLQIADDVGRTTLLFTRRE